MSAVHQLEVLPAPAPRRHLRALPDVVEVEQASGVRRRVLARRRFAAVLVLCVVLAGAFLAGRALAADGGAGPVSVTVHSGETLSDVAVRELPTMPMREGVAALQAANNLPTSHVDAGQRLVIPSR